MAKKNDPTVTSDATADAPEGSHPARPVDEAADAASNKKYKDNPDKPDPTTVAQVEVE
jgi:hypothetical protein